MANLSIFDNLNYILSSVFRENIEIINLAQRTIFLKICMNYCWIFKIKSC